jgi:rRNA processing protein Gar1
MARPPTYQSDYERPITVSVRIPQDLYAQAKQYVSLRRTTLTALLLDGLRLRLDTPADPRDILVSQDNTGIQELQEMIRAAVQAEIGTLRDVMGPRVSTPGAMSAPEAPAAPRAELSYNDNTVLQKKAPREAGKRGGMRQRILTLLGEHPEGLSAEEIRAYLKPENPIGDTLQGMRVQEKVKTRGRGKDMRYFVE